MLRRPRADAAERSQLVVRLRVAHRAEATRDEAPFEGGVGDALEAKELLVGEAWKGIEREQRLRRRRRDERRSECFEGAARVLGEPPAKARRHGHRRALREDAPDRRLVGRREAHRSEPRLVGEEAGDDGVSRAERLEPACVVVEREDAGDLRLDLPWAFDRHAPVIGTDRDRRGSERVLVEERDREPTVVERRARATGRGEPAQEARGRREGVIALCLDREFRHLSSLDPATVSLVSYLSFPWNARLLDVDVVAVVALGGTVESEAPLLAGDLGMTAYEAALMLRVPSPMQVLRTDDRARALDLLGRLRARGHQAVACDLEGVSTGDALEAVKSFRLEADAFVADAIPSTMGRGEERRLRWTDIVAIVRAIHKTRTERVSKSEEKKLSLGRAALTGGLLVSKSVTKETRTSNEEREQVLYVFPAMGAPWLLAETRLDYLGLGPELRPVKIENFGTLMRIVRERAINAAYDERLLLPRPGAERVRTLVRGHRTSSSAEGVDILAHLVAAAITRPSPYRWATS